MAVDKNTHWIHVSANRDACPVFPGDSRITMVPIEEETVDQLVLAFVEEKEQNASKAYERLRQFISETP